MKKLLIALVAACAPLGAMALTAPPQVGVGNCDCIQDATYTDSGNQWPACVQSFGLTWTRTQNGICAKPGCPAAQPCEGEVTMSAVGNCSWTIAVWESESGQFTGAVFDDGFTVPVQYSMACKEFWLISWGAEGVELGSHKFECKDCKPLQQK